MLKKSVAGGRHLLIWWLGTSAVKYIKAREGLDKISHPNTIEYGGRRQALPLLECLGFPLLGLQERVNFVEKEAHPNWQPVSSCQPAVLSKYSTSRSVSICFAAATFQAFQFVGDTLPLSPAKTKDIASKAIGSNASNGDRFQEMLGDVLQVRNLNGLGLTRQNTIRLHRRCRRLAN